MTARLQRWAEAKPWHTNAALLVLGFCLLLLSRQLVSEFHHYSIGYSGVSSLSLLMYGAAVWLVLTQPVNRATFGIILAVAIACRLVLVFPEPKLSSDVYRYAWDGVVQHAHINPYRYVPGDSALSSLRAPNWDLFTHINRRDYAHTIYPPAAQAIFYGITFLNPTVTFMKVAMVLFEGLTLYALLELLSAFGMRREQSLIYAWCPMLIWEIASSGHVDSIVMAFLALAVLARYRQQPVRTGLFLGLAILSKLYPVVLLPAFFRRGEYKMPATVAAVIAAGYACYLSVGWGVFGFLGGYAQEEGIEAGTRYFLLELVRHVPGLQHTGTTFFLAFAALVFAALTVWAWRTCCRSGIGRSLSKRQSIFLLGAGWFPLPPGAEFLVPSFAFASVLMLLFSPHYPWYLAWLVPFLTLVPNLTVFTYVCGLYYLCTTALAVGYGPKQFELNEILYGIVLLALAIELVFRRWPVHRRLLAAGRARTRRNTLEYEVQRHS